MQRFKYYFLFIVCFFFEKNLHGQSIAQTRQQLIDQKKAAIAAENARAFYRMGPGGSTNTIQANEPEQNCKDAIPVCQDTYIQPNSYVDDGTITDFTQTSTCLEEGEKNAVWYTFTTQTFGNLYFTIDPNDPFDDYDWALFNITNKSCANINNGTLAPVSCNYSATKGQTGLTNAGTSNSENAGGNKYCKPLATPTWQTFVLVVSNFSSSQSGYTLKFNTSLPGAAQIYDNIKPKPQSLNYACGSNTIFFTPSELLKCSSIAANGSDFTLTNQYGTTIPITSASGINCTGTTTAKIKITLANPLYGFGPWILKVKDGSDNNTLLDQCDNAMLVGDTLGLRIPQKVTINLDAQYHNTETKLTDVKWTIVNPASIPTTTFLYELQKKVDPSTTWSTQLFTTNLNYLDSTIKCTENVKYQVKLYDSLSCTIANSNIDSIILHDIYAPPLLTSPVLRCLKVNEPTGSITLTWAPPSPVPNSNFTKYFIYRSTSLAGPYDIIDTSITVANTNTFTDATLPLLPPAVAADGNANSYFYYIESRSGCFGNTPSIAKDTLQSIHLSATSVTYSGIADLKWNALRKPNIASSSGVYKVFRNYPANVWQQIANTVDTFYSDPVHVCDEIIAYRIEIDDAYGCTSASNNDTIRVVDSLALPRVVSPSLRCASVNTDGSVDLSWVASTNTQNSFYAYAIYRSTSLAGPYMLIDSLLSINQTTYTDNLLGVNAQSNSYFYFIRVWSGCGGHLVSPPIDTLQTIKMDVVPASASVADLSWNQLTNPNLASSSGVYTIYREYPLGTWTALSNTALLKHLDTVNVCSSLLNYKVIIADQSGCSSSSSFDGDIFKDLTKPNTPVLDSVSVDLGTGAIQLGWSPSSSNDVVAYIIYYFNGTSFVAIDTVHSATNRYYLDNVQNPFTPANNASKAPQVYCISALDSCNNVSLLSQYQQSVFLKVVPDQCNYENNLDWTPYVNWPVGVTKYDILMSKDAAPFVLIGSVAGTDTSFVHTNLDKGSTYCYLVRAYARNASFTALSNDACVKMAVPIIPQFVYVSHATVLDKNKIEIGFLTDTVAHPQGYNVKKSLYDNGPFEQLSYVPYSYPNPFLTVTDTDVLTDSLNYVYSITVIDTCGKEGVSSNIGKSILLRTHSEINLINILNWSAYKNFDAGVAEYKIFRSIDGVSTNAVHVASVPGIITSYEDNVADFNLTSGSFCYFVRAMENAGNQYQLRDSSTSNVACTKQEPTVYIPNAFYPLSEIPANRTFKPISMFISADGYQFAIFDRWGQEVFHTSIPGDAWDGKYKGEFAGTNVFIYSLRYKDIYGGSQLKSGTVTLIK